LGDNYTHRGQLRGELKTGLWLIFLQESLNLPYFFIEDVYMGGFVADRCLMPKKELPGFSPGIDLMNILFGRKTFWTNSHPQIKSLLSIMDCNLVFMAF
jgi:hypothetical protein